MFINMKKSGLHPNERSLSRQGYEILGSGCYGVALAHPKRPNVVVKVAKYGFNPGSFNDLGEFFPRDGWLTYVKHLANDPSPHALRVHSVAVFEEQFFAVMERLLPGDYENDETAKSIKAVTGSGNPEHLPGTLGQFGERVLKVCRETDRGIDCHAGNIMFRRDGTPVITDPYV
jgi:hypothetical protein